jgi:hypothetical protein
LQFCSLFELQHRRFSELHIAAQVVSIEDRLDVLEAVAVKVAICGTVASARANRTTADPNRSPCR